MIAMCGRFEHLRLISRQPSQDARQDARSSAPRRGAPEILLQPFRPFQKQGRGECRAPSAPAAPYALGSGICARVFTAEAPEIARHSRTRMVLTAYFALSLVTSSFLSPSPRRLKGLARPVGPPKPPRDLTPATGARTTRLRRPRRLRKSRSTGLVPVPPKL
jgi:hypothetical protein